MNVNKIQDQTTQQHQKIAHTQTMISLQKKASYIITPKDHHLLITKW